MLRWLPYRRPGGRLQRGRCSLRASSLPACPAHACPARLLLQDRRSGRGHVSVTAVGAPATALTVREDHSMLGVGTAGGPAKGAQRETGWGNQAGAVICTGACSWECWRRGAFSRLRHARLGAAWSRSLSPAPPGQCSSPADGVVKLYDPRNTRQPLKTLRVQGGPVSCLHWQHRFLSLSRQRAAAAPACASKPAAAAAASQPLPLPPAASSGVSVAPSAAAPAPSIKSRIPAADASATGEAVPGVAVQRLFSSALHSVQCVMLPWQMMPPTRPGLLLPAAQPLLQSTTQACSRAVLCCWWGCQTLLPALRCPGAVRSPLRVACLDLCRRQCTARVRISRHLPWRATPGQRRSSMSLAAGEGRRGCGSRGGACSRSPHPQLPACRHPCRCCRTSTGGDAADWPSIAACCPCGIGVGRSHPRCSSQRAGSWAQQC